MHTEKFFLDLFGAFTSLKVLIVGDVMVDAYLFGTVDRISPEAPVPIVTVNRRENRLGGAANVARNIIGLGAKPFLCSVIGNDIKGREFLELLSNEGIHGGGLLQSNTRITTTKSRVIGNKMQLLRIDEEMDKDLSPDERNELMHRIHRIIKDEDINVIIFQDYDKGVIDPALIREVVQLAREHNIPVVVDPKKRNFSEYKNISLFKPNLKELREGLKAEMEADDLQRIDFALDMLMDRQDIGMALVTLSESGVYVRKQNKGGLAETYNIPAHIRSIADVSGAGDTVVSTAALCLASGLDPQTLAAVSNIAGGLVCEEVGVVPVNREKLLQEVIRLLV